MANLGNHAMAATTSLLVVAIFMLCCCLHPADAQIGVAYGNSGDNLPSPTEVVSLYKSNGIGAMRKYYPNTATLEALKGSGIKVTLGVGMDELQRLGSDPSAADKWVQDNVKRFASSVDFKYIVVGNEISDSSPLASSVLKAMQNVLKALNKNDLGDKNIKVSTSIGTELVTDPYPPSKSRFSNLTYMAPIIKFLKEHVSSLMANIYPYFADKVYPEKIHLDYALFTMPAEKAVVDINNGLKYQNVFDALADATYAAIQKVVAATAEKDVAGVGAEKVGKPNNDMSLLVSESGWSSSGGKFSPPTRLSSRKMGVLPHWIMQGRTTPI